MYSYLGLNERGHRMTPNKTPDQSPKPEWFELTENQTPSTGLRKVNKVLPIATLVVAGAVILGGSIFANANNEQSAVTENPTASQSVVAQASPSSELTTSSKVTSGTSGVNSLPVPAITNVPERGFGDHEEFEGREERHERGERFRDHEDDRHEDDRHEDEDGD
jgi:hypothetical protein